MALSRLGLALALAGMSMVPAMAQTRAPRCLHAENETEAQGQRRIEALNAADLINRMIDRRPRNSEYPTWAEFAKSPMVASYLGMAGPRGDLARKIQWGAEQPLPGWEIHYIAAQDGYAFSLTDLRDPCSLTFASNDTGMLIQGRPAERGPVRVIPLDSTH